MGKYLNIVLCVISLCSVIYFFVSFFWISKKPFSDLGGRDIGYVAFWLAIFFLTLLNSVKYFRFKG